MYPNLLDIINLLFQYYTVQLLLMFYIFRRSKCEQYFG